MFCFVFALFFFFVVFFSVSFLFCFFWGGVVSETGLVFFFVISEMEENCNLVPN